MLRYLSLRVLYTLPVVWLVVSLVFLLIHLVPGDPIQQMLGEGAPAADIEAARHAYGLDAPIRTQYLNYWKGVLHGDRKSTRLNSSHSQISYAVFCLKNKKLCRTVVVTIHTLD